MWLNYFWIAAPAGYGRSWSSNAADDDELLQMMDNLEECLTINANCQLRCINCLVMLC